MFIFRNIIYILLVVSISGCGSNRATLKEISYEEANSFINSLKTTTQDSEPKIIEKLYVQPINKNVPCKLRTSKDQLERNNFRSYWDGKCKDGYAFGLGRDIAISDTHHVEEISVIGSDDVPFVYYDYVNNFWNYGVNNEKTRTYASVSTNIVKGKNKLWFRSLYSKGNEGYILESSPFYTESIRRYIDGNIEYKFTSKNDMSLVEPNKIAAAFETLDVKKQQKGGFVIFKYDNDSTRHFKLTNGVSTEEVRLPKQYIDKLVLIGNLMDKHFNQDAQNASNRAQQIEREYLYMACNGKHKIKNLDIKTSTMICTWKDKFKDSIEKTAKEYESFVEKERKKIKESKENILRRNQAVMQQQAEQQRQQNNNVVNGLNAFAKGMNDLGKGMQQSVPQYYSPPIVQPMIQPQWGQQNKRVNCVTVGSVTNCR